MDKSNYSEFLKRVDEQFSNRIKSKFNLDDKSYHAFVKEKAADLNINNYKIIKDHTLEEYFNSYQKYLGRNVLVYQEDELWLMDPKKTYWEIKNDSKGLYFEVPSKALMFMYPYGCILTAFLLVAGITVGVLCGTLLNRGSTSGGGGGGDNPEPIPTPTKKWYEYTEAEGWWNYCSNGVDAVQATEDDIGKTVNLTVNNINQPVRLIGIEHDDLVAGGKAHCTFEFANLLCDSDGYSIATIWDCRNGNSTNNEDFEHSNIRAALDGSGGATISWYQKESVTKSTTYTAPVLNMLPEGLQSSIKEIKKPIAQGTTFDVSTYNTKLFILSYSELTETSNTEAKLEGPIYEYYKGPTGDIDSNRIKNQIKGNVGAASTFTVVTDGPCSHTNFAGIYINGGSYYSTRSPRAFQFFHGHFFACFYDGKISHIDDSKTPIVNMNVFYVVFPLAPAFCI